MSSELNFYSEDEDLLARVHNCSADDLAGVIDDALTSIAGDYDLKSSSRGYMNLVVLHLLADWNVSLSGALGAVQGGYQAGAGNFGA